jgi:hypothetical protein
MKKHFLKFLFGLTMLIFIAVLFLPLNGKIVEEIDAGTVMSVEEVSTSWNDLQRTRVETDKAVLYVRGVISVMKGVPAKIKKYESGRQYLCLSDHDKCLKIIDKT